MPGLLVCLSVEDDADAVLAEATRLSRDLEAPLSIIQVYPAFWHEPLPPRPGAWHLRTDNPLKPLRRFAARNRITHIILGQDSCC